MKTLYFDCFAGASGDMIVGALIELGLEPEDLQTILDELPLTGCSIEVSKVNKSGIQAAAFRVLTDENGKKSIADSDFIETPHLSSPIALHTTESAPSRTLQEILELIDNSGLSDRVKTTSQQIFVRLGEAEAKVHGTTINRVHFHEVGGLDAIIDIVSAVIGLEKLGIEEVFASPVPLGSGFIKSSHGLLPVPAPATAELLRGVPIQASQVAGELITPTGAAILTTVAKGFGAIPEMTIQRIGYGAGSRDRDFPNVLRAYLGESKMKQGFSQRNEPRDPDPGQHLSSQDPGGYHSNQAVILEANLDDSNPQLFENLIHQLFEAGALDVILIPVYMKKYRPGVMLQVLASQDKKDSLLQIIFRESTTIGVRSYPVTKHMLNREILFVSTELGNLRIKISRLGDQVVNAAPEYEDCLELARQTGVPLKEVIQMALTAYSRLVRR